MERKPHLADLHRTGHTRIGKDRSPIRTAFGVDDLQLRLDCRSDLAQRCLHGRPWIEPDWERCWRWGDGFLIDAPDLAVGAYVHLDLAIEMGNAGVARLESKRPSPEGEGFDRRLNSPKDRAGAAGRFIR